jgi:SPP1 family predicted phage head-tail adaptor
MKAGDLIDQIELQSVTGETRDAFGASAPTWTTYATVWAEIKPVSARQLDLGRTYADSVSHAIRIRYRAGVSPTHRAKFGSRIFTVDGVVETDRRVELTLFATEIVS